MKKLCIFDLDGTLIDSLEDLAEAMHHAIARQGFAVHSTDRYRMMVGSGLSVLTDRAAGAPDSRYTDAVKQEIVADFNQYYTRHCLDHTKPYPGIPALLEELNRRSIAFAVNSNKPDAFSNRIVSALIPKAPFSFVWGKREGCERKPSPDGALGIMQGLGFRPEETVYIGDSDVDVYTAANAGISFCGVRWGFRSPQELIAAGAVHLAESPEELLQLILTVD